MSGHLHGCACPSSSLLIPRVLFPDSGLPVMQFDPSMVEAKPAAEKDSEDQDNPSVEAMPLEPSDSALQVPKLPAAGEVTTLSAHALFSPVPLEKASDDKLAPFVLLVKVLAARSGFAIPTAAISDSEHCHEQCKCVKSYQCTDAVC